MRMDKLTSRFQQALADAQSLAVGRDHQFLEPAHVLLALLDSQGGTVRPLLVKAGADVPRTHDLRRLSALVTAAYPDWSADEEPLVRLTHAAVLYRYPGGHATADEARDLLRDAHALRLRLTSVLDPSPPPSTA